MRDIFKAQNLIVSAVDYYEPVAFYQSSASSIVNKNIGFFVFFDNQLILRYFLESSVVGGMLYYALCSMSINNQTHRVIKAFSNKKPKYEELRNFVINDLVSGAQALIYTTNPTPNSNYNPRV